MCVFTHAGTSTVIDLNNTYKAATKGWPEGDQAFHCIHPCRSTLVYDRKLNTFHHLDSLPLNNSAHARQCASKITPFLKGIYTLL